MSQEKPKHVAILYKSKLNLEQATKARRGMRYKGLPFFLSSALNWVGGQRHAPAVLLPE